MDMNRWESYFSAQDMILFLTDSRFPLSFEQWIRIRLLRPVCPDAIVTDDLATDRSLASKALQALLAALSTGGAVRLILSASPYMPTT